MWSWLEGILSTPDQEQARVVLLISAVALGALIFLLFAKTIGISKRRATQRTETDFNWKRFEKIAGRRGLRPADTELLMLLSRRYGLTEPTRLLTDRKLLTDLIDRAEYALKCSTDLPDYDLQLWLARYFRLEELLDSDVATDPQRRYQRHVLERPCIITPIRIVAQRHPHSADMTSFSPAVALAAERQTMAELKDVSVGGCSVRSLGAFELGCLVNIEFELDPCSPVSVVGRIRHVRAQCTIGNMVHVQFTKLSPEHFNRIHRFVYKRMRNVRLSSNVFEKEPLSTFFRRYDVQDV